MTPGIVGAIAVGAALASDVCVAGITFVCGTWIKDRLNKQPEIETIKPQSRPREFVAVLGGNHD